MLRLCHELPRYSLDMDFWFVKDTEFEEFFDRLSEMLGKDHNVTDSWNKHYSILVELQIAKGSPKLKIEMRKSVAPRGSSEEKIAFSPHFPEQVLVRGFTLEQMFRNKVEALMDRGEIRDAFDLEFLARKGIVKDFNEKEKDGILSRLESFNESEFKVKLGSILMPELRDYYRQNRFRFLEEWLSFKEWKK